MIAAQDSSHLPNMVQTPWRVVGPSRHGQSAVWQPTRLECVPAPPPTFQQRLRPYGAQRLATAGFQPSAGLQPSAPVTPFSY